MKKKGVNRKTKNMDAAKIFEEYLKGIETEGKTGKVAIMLAMSSRNDENALIQLFNGMGFKCGVTETGGMRQDIEKKISNSLIGMGLNLNILRKDTSDIHAAVHASIEACNGLLLHSPMMASYSLKIALARKDRWLSVAIYGHSAAHSLTNHERIGMGTMHIESF
jgi:hut operon positive regulator